MFRFTSLLASTLVLLSVSPAAAGIINGAFSPDIAVGTVTAAYNSGTGLFTLDGFAGEFTDPSGLQIYQDQGVSGSPGTFHLQMTIDGAGVVTPNTGFFEVVGTLDTNDAKVTLLKGTITEVDATLFNLSNGYGTMEILADITEVDGSMPNLGGLGGLVGVKFTNPIPMYGMSMGAADVGRPVPEPASMAVFASTFALGLCRIRRKRRLAIS